MRKRRNILLVTATALMCAVSFALPGAVLALRDVTLARSTETVAVDELELNLLSRLDPAQKLTLAADASAASIPLEGGRNMTGSDASKTAFNWAMEVGFPLEDIGDIRSEAQLRVGSGGEGAVMWDVTFSGQNESGRFLIDDETGWVLGAAVFIDYLGTGAVSYAPDVSSQENAALEDEIDAGKTPSASAGSAPEEYRYYGGDFAAEDESGMEILTPDEDFHFEAGLFLGPMGVEYTIITRESPDSARIHIAADSGSVEVPITLNYNDTASYLSVNMPSMGVPAPEP